MAFATASTKKEDVQQGGSNHIVKSGVYPIRILAPIVSISKNGSTTIDLYLEHNGQKQVLYGNLRITNNDGTPNKIGAKIFNQLLIIGGLEAVADPIEVELPVGKKEALKMVSVLEDMADMDVLMRVQMEYGVYKGSFTEKKNIKSFFRTDKATAEEIVNESDIGAGYEAEMKYVDNITFKDGATPEAIENWIKAKRPEGTAGNATSPSASGKEPAFGKKRFGEKAE